MEEVVVFVTCTSEEEAEKIARVLLEAQLAACINILPSITSLFSWEGTIQKESEVLLIIKTLRSVFGSLEKTVQKHHSYDLPEMIALPIIEGEKAYLNWIRTSIRTDQQ